MFLKTYAVSCLTRDSLGPRLSANLFVSAILTGLRRTMSHHTIACPAIVIEVSIRPLVANRGTKYVSIEAVGMLAARLGTCEFLFRTVGNVKRTSPALPIDISKSTKVTISASFS